MTYQIFECSGTTEPAKLLPNAGRSPEFAKMVRICRFQPEIKVMWFQIEKKIYYIQVYREA